VGVTLEAVAEALALADASGVDPAKVRAALLGGFAQSKVLEVHGQRMIDRNFVPGFKAKLHRKDMNIAAEAGDERALDLVAAKLVRERFDELLAKGEGELDHSALRTLYPFEGAS
jgi:2-hydroxy-3-oxopropionate reductase